MQIEKQTQSFYNLTTGEIDEHPVYKISFRSLSVMETDLTYALRKMFIYARHKKLLNINES